MLPNFKNSHGPTRTRTKVLLVLASLAIFFGVFKAGQYYGKSHMSGYTGRYALDALPAVRTVPTKGEFEPWIETVSWKPRIFVYHNFLSQTECDQILELAASDVARSAVVGPEGKPVVSDYRTSNGVFLGEQYMMKSKMLRDLERRIADWTHLPREGGEHFYLIRYEKGQQYKAHQDYFSGGLEGPEGNRIATVLMYIGTPDEGGETTFPDVGLQVKARKGDAVLFWDYKPDCNPDPLTLHAAKPVLAGTKWSMTKWIRPRKTHRWTDHLSQADQDFLDQEDKDWARMHSSAKPEEHP